MEPGARPSRRQPGSGDAAQSLGPGPVAGAGASFSPRSSRDLPCPSGPARPPPRTAVTGPGLHQTPRASASRGPSSSPFYLTRLEARPAALAVLAARTQRPGRVSQASCPSLPPAPAMAPQNVQVNPLTASQLEVTWDPPPPESQNGNVQGYKASSAPRGPPRRSLWARAAESPDGALAPHTLPLSAHLFPGSCGGHSHHRPAEPWPS